MEFASNDVGDEKRFRERLEEDDDFLCSRRLFRLLSHQLSVYFVMSAASLRSFTSIDESDAEEEVGGVGRTGSCSFPALFTACDSFPISVRVYFATGRKKRDDTRVQIEQAFTNIEDLVHF